MQTMKKYITSRHRRLEQSPLNRFQLLRLIKLNGEKKEKQRRQVGLVELINYVPISCSLLGTNRSPDYTFILIILHHDKNCRLGTEL